MDTDTSLVLLGLAILIVVSFLTGFYISQKLTDTDQIKNQLKILTSQPKS